MHNLVLFVIQKNKKTMIKEICSELKIGTQGAFSVDFIGKGNIWVNNTYEESVSNLTKSIIAEALKRTAPGQLSIVGYDSDLSGIFAPFASLSTGESKTLELISDKKGFETYLDYIWQQIVSVQNVIQGRTCSLLEFRRATGRPIEGYKLVVLSLDMGLIDNDLRSKIAMLLRSGPDCGVSFVIVSTTLMTIQTQSGRDIELSVEALASNITILETSGSKVTKLHTKQSAQFLPLQAQELIDECDTYIRMAKVVQLPTVRYDELHNMNRMWFDSSIDGLTFSIGMYGVNNMEITIGDEINQRHNAIITGAVGQGKSNLISMIIHSLCHRYSPKELQMYLLDFKEGVTFKAFSNIGQDEYLPHAKALGLESDSSFGLAVLTFLFKEYQHRMKILKDNNLKSIRDLRMKNRGMHMPRILVIIDEFQLMFDDLQTSQKIADMLEKSVRLFRAAGIHFILASQTLSDASNVALSQKKESLFSQVPIRIALKNSLTESQQTLGMNNPAAAFLRPREAIANLDYGEVTQNRKTVVAFADEILLEPLRRTWWEKAKNDTKPPYVFESERRITIQSGISTIGELRKSAKVPYALIGEKISIDGERVALPMTREFGRNIAIIGTPDAECNNAYGMMQSAAVSLAIQHPKGDARFLFCDFNGEYSAYDKKFPQFSTLMEGIGFFIECIPPAVFQDTIQQLQSENIGDDTVYIFGSNMDRWEFEKDPYGQGSPLKSFVETASAKGIHFIGWWQKASNFNAQVSGYGSSDAFNTKIFLRVDERTVQSLTSPFVRWTSQANRAMISDSVEFSEEITFVPYAPVEQRDTVAFRTQMWN